MTQYKLPGYQTPVIKHSKPHLTTKKPYATKKENGPPVPKSSYQPPGYKEAEKKKEENNKRPTSPAGAAPFKTQSGMSFHRFFFDRSHVDSNCFGKLTAGVHCSCIVSNIMLTPMKW